MTLPTTKFTSYQRPVQTPTLQHFVTHFPDHKACVECESFQLGRQGESAVLNKQEARLQSKINDKTHSNFKS